MATHFISHLESENPEAFFNRFFDSESQAKDFIEKVPSYKDTDLVDCGKHGIMPKENISVYRIRNGKTQTRSMLDGTGNWSDLV